MAKRTSERSAGWTRRGAILSALAAAGCTAEEIAAGIEILNTASSLSQGEASLGIREALRVGTGAAVTQVGRTNGYLTDQAVRIPLPSTLQDVRGALSAVGFASVIDEVEVKMNRAAEQAAPAARDIFFSAITAMTIQDAVGIVRGGSNSATQYFQRTMTPRLVQAFTPPMEAQLQSTGAIAAFDSMVARLRTVPLAPQLAADAKTQLVSHGVREAVDGLFYYVGREELKIRANPAAYGSDLLIRVFG